MANSYFIHSTHFQSGTTIRATHMNDTFVAVEVGFENLEAHLKKRLAIHPGVEVGNLEIPNVSVANSILMFDENKNLIVWNKSEFDADVALAKGGSQFAQASLDSSIESEKSAVRSEASAALLGQPVMVQEGGSHSIHNNAIAADVVFLGNGTVNLPTTLVVGRRFTIRVSVSAPSNALGTIVNPSFKITGNKDAALAGTDVQLSPGAVMVLEVISETELEII